MGDWNIIEFKILDLRFKIYDLLDLGSIIKILNFKS